MAKPKKKSSLSWAVKIALVTFAIATMINLLSESVMRGVGFIIALCILLFIILLGIVFDIIGIAVASASLPPLASMAAKKMKGAKQAVRLLQNAPSVSNFCNDVVGDICGIISGSAGAAIAARILMMASSTKEVLAGVLVSASIAALTVGGKALGKGFAMKKSSTIVLFVGKILYTLGYQRRVRK